MKHFVKKHTHHFGLWALSGLLLIWSMIWLNNLNQETAQSALIYKTAEIKSANSSTDTEMKSSKILPRFAPQDDKKDKPISADALANNVISVITPTKDQKEILRSLPAGQAGAQNDKDEQAISVTFKIITPTTSKEFTLQVLPQSTVYDAMKQLQSQIPIKFTAFSGLGAFVEAIDNLANNSKTNLFWIYYINGQAAKLGVSSIKLNPNDIITWQYEQAKY